MADDDQTARRTETIPAAPREPVAEAMGDEPRRPTALAVEGDDHEEAGYGYGV